MWTFIGYVATCSNPCFNGISVEQNLKNKIWKRLYYSNPCFNGISVEPEEVVSGKVKYTVF